MMRYTRPTNYGKLCGLGLLGVAKVLGSRPCQLYITCDHVMRHRAFVHHTLCRIAPNSRLCQVRRTPILVASDISIELIRIPSLNPRSLEFHYRRI
jgi:hypothetical protein